MSMYRWASCELHGALPRAAEQCVRVLGCFLTVRPAHSVN